MENVITIIPYYNNNITDIKKTFSSFSEDCNILVIDDGSKPSFSEIVGDTFSAYLNLEIITLNENRGIENALKTALSLVVDKYEYIARLDIGDKSDLTRFAKQKKFLDDNRDYVIVGTWAKFVNEHGELQFLYKTPIEDERIRKLMYKNNMFVHPSVMFRSSAIKKSGNYSDRFKACEDYDLFFRLLSVGKGYNIPEGLTVYEVNFNSISSKKRQLQVINRIKIICVNFKFLRYGFYPYYGLIRSVVMLLIGRKQSSFINKIIKGSKI